QIKATKQVSGTLRLDLASFRELQAFAQFASDLDDYTRGQLERGQRMVEVLKQGPYAPVPIEKQVVIIFAGAQGYLDDIPVASVTKFEADLMPFMEAKHSNILDSIRTEKKISDDTDAQLRKAIEDFKASFAE
ncbi:MAG: F0F1 ATP synthase subunit alpha, partial [Sulfurovum sp.]|nr:F0F1 ATP synthase subunit alpha [Sulfurovum sp.]